MLDDGRREEQAELKSQGREADRMTETIKREHGDKCGEEMVSPKGQCPLIYGDLKQNLGKKQRK